MHKNKGLIYSFIAHILFLLLAIVKIVVYPDTVLDLSRAIRVDMIDLPEKIDVYQMPVEDLKQISNKLPEKIAEPEKASEPEPKPKIEPVAKVKPADDSININKIKSEQKMKQKQKEALNKLKTSAALEKLKKETSDEKPSQKLKSVFKGRALSAGTSLSGLDKLQSDSYLSQLDAKIKAQWTLPQWLIGKNLRTRVHIKIEENGSIIYKKLTQSSGNSTYDEYCMQAITRAQDLPQVPEKFTTVYKIDGFIIGFPD